MAYFAGNARWAESSTLFAHRVRCNPLNCRKLVPGACTREGIAAQAVVGSIVWVFRRLKKPRSREMSARAYALHSVCTQRSFFISRTRTLMALAYTITLIRHCNHRNMNAATLSNHDCDQLVKLMIYRICNSTVYNANMLFHVCVVGHWFGVMYKLSNACGEIEDSGVSKNIN